METNENYPPWYYNLVMLPNSKPRPERNQVREFLQRRLTLRQLRLLVVLDEYQQISRAAKALSLTQPAVSKALAELESGLGMRLFDRTNKGLYPSPEGICMIEHAQAIEENLARAALTLESVCKANTWHLTVGVMHSAFNFVSVALLQMQKTRPGAQSFCLTFHEGGVDTLLTSLRAGRLDIVVGTAPQGGLAAGLQITPLYSDPLVWIAACDHPLALKPHIEPKDLCESVWVMAPRTTRVRHSIDAALRKLRLPVSPRMMETVSFSTKIRLVCDHGAVALIPRSSALSEEARSHVRILDIDMGALALPVSAITCDEHESRAEILEFMEGLVQACAGA